MTRLLLLALLLSPLTGIADSIYRTTDAQGNIIYTDAPPANSQPSDRVEINRTNTAEPPQELTYPTQSDPAETRPAAPPYVVTIISPANETSYPMGPGNFSVSARTEPALRKYESLQLFIDGTPQGDPQRSSFWDLTNVFRGQHDLTVSVLDAHGKVLASSEPVRVFVHRPSINFKNRQ